MEPRRASEKQAVQGQGAAMTLSRVVSPFDAPAYLERCENLFQVLRANLPWSQMHYILDLGCGSGEMGHLFRSAHKTVMSVDGRYENIERLVVQDYFALCRDVHEPLPMSLTADLVLCLGLLYHSEDPMRILENCARAAPIICVETLCMDQEGIYFLSFQEETERIDQSLDGGCCRFSPAWLERALKRVGYQRIEDVSQQVKTVEGDGFHQGFRYDWEFRNTGDSYRDGYGLRKLWIAYK